MSIRITELDAITSLQSGDYIAVDNESTGTHKFDALNIGANIGQNIANTYSSSASYAIGQYCLYDNNLYKCTTTISTPEAWNSSHWIQVTVGEGLYEKVDKISGKGLSTNDFTNEYKQKLGGIEAGAEVNVQANWAETNTSSDSYIQNKPGNATTETSGFMSASDKQKLNGIASGAEVNVQPNWAEDDSSKDDYIKNKPTIDTALSESSDNAVRNSAITAGINQVQGNLDTEITNRQNAVSGEQLARENADSALDGRLDTVEETLPNKANIDGSYDSMTVGNAEQLTTDIRANDQTPYLFRTAGGSVDIGDREYINGIVGGTVAFNQICKMPTSGAIPAGGATLTYSADGATLTINGTTTATAYLQLQLVPKTTIGHVYFAGINRSDATKKINLYNDGGGINTANGSVYSEQAVGKATANNSWYVRIPSGESFAGTETVKPIIIDLTLMFGSTIADYIYSLEQATAGAGVAFFKTLFPKPYYAYNAGELKSVKGLVSHDMVGFNQVNKDEVVNNKYIVTSTGEEDASNASAHTGFIRVTPQTNYYTNATAVAYFSTVVLYDADKNYIGYISGSSPHVFNTGNAHYIIVNTVKAQMPIDDLVVNLAWDNSRNGEYEPYQKWSYPLDSDLELRGVPKIENGNLYYDGDVYEADGTVTRTKRVMDLNDAESFENIGVPAQTASGVYYCDVYKKIADRYGTDDAPAICFPYSIIPTTTTGMSGYAKNYASAITVYDDALAGMTTSQAKAYLISKGFKAVFDLPAARYTTETADPYTNPQIVNDFGTEEFVISNTVAVPIPVGHNTDYPINLKAKVEMAPNSPDGDGDYIVRQTNGTNEYVSIANNSTISSLVSRSPVASGADGTYVLKATISGGTVTYSWEAE